MRLPWGGKGRPPIAPMTPELLRTAFRCNKTCHHKGTCRRLFLHSRRPCSSHERWVVVALILHAPASDEETRLWACSK